MIDNKLINVDMARALKYLGYHKYTTCCYMRDEDGWNWKSLYYPAYRWDVIESIPWLKYYINNIHICRDWTLPNYGFIDFNLNIAEMSNYPEMVSMPTFHEVTEWFRSVYGIHISIEIDEESMDKEYKCRIQYEYQDAIKYKYLDGNDYLKLYEDALTECISLARFNHVTKRDYKNNYTDGFYN